MTAKEVVPDLEVGSFVAVRPDPDEADGELFWIAQVTDLLACQDEIGIQWYQRRQQGSETPGKYGHFEVCRDQTSVITLTSCVHPIQGRLLPKNRGLFELQEDLSAFFVPSPRPRKPVKVSPPRPSQTSPSKRKQSSHARVIHYGDPKKAAAAAKRQEKARERKEAERKEKARLREQQRVQNQQRRLEAQATVARAKEEAREAKRAAQVETWSALGKKRYKKDTTVLNSASHDTGGPEEEMSEYERARLARIQANRAQLAALGVEQVKEEIVHIHNTVNARPVPTLPRKRRAPSTTAIPKVRRRSQRAAQKTRINYDEDALALSTSTDLRRRRVQVQGSSLGQDTVTRAGDDGTMTSLKDEDEEVTHDIMYTCQEYCEWKGITPLFHTDDHFTGWVNPEVAKAHGIADSATEAWEQGGGGKITKSTPLGTGVKIRQVHGESRAKAVSRAALRKNPNCYFYRHCAPGVDQWGGAWTQEEHDLFLETAKKYGVGDKWGLFASYIPHRVGYQCSAYYRECIIPAGLITSDAWILNSQGHATYVKFASAGRKE